MKVAPAFLVLLLALYCEASGHAGHRALLRGLMPFFGIAIDGALAYLLASL